MNYPFWDVPHIGSGWVIGMIAIFHVMISHFAVGGGLYLPMTERKALREGRKDWLQTLRWHSKFFLILTGVFGAVTGVGIWFAIGLAHPEATSALIHNFVFGWAIEWVFFMVELTSAAVYYYTWDRVPEKLHLAVGWVYGVTSFLTLVIINGILTFQLTPGQPWLDVAGTGHEATRFWQAFFNPTYWPSLCLRVLACLALAGVWSMVTCARIDAEKLGDLKESLARWSAQWMLPAFILLPWFFGWYLWNVPEAQRALLQLGVSSVGTGSFTQVTRTIIIIPLASVSVVGLVYFFAWRTPRKIRMGHAAAILMVALFATASTEYGREMLRKPYVIGRYMYSNGIRVADNAKINANGYLTKSAWTRQLGPNATAQEKKLACGEAMYRGQCGSCHTRDVYRSMKRMIGERNRDAITSILTLLREAKDESPYKKYMPQLAGTPDEIEALGDYLNSLK
jgi:cytochrome bd-type quinol oxidase subunit 1